jgi:RNA-directed DNA polymerase
MNYYGRFYRSQMYPLLRRINTYLMRWVGKKYKRLGAYKRFKRWWSGMIRPRTPAIRSAGLYARAGRIAARRAE